MITTLSQLEQIVGIIRDAGFVAIDTEFVWERTYYPRLGLVQLGLGDKGNYLLDVLSIDDLSLLGEIISDPDIVIILHDAVQDLMILYRATGALPSNIFDTRLAAGFVGLRSTISLRDIVLELLGVELTKTASRTNWLQRPLADEQIEYALGDVQYLPEVWKIESLKAEQMGNFAQLKSELAFLEQSSHYLERPSAEVYERIKGANRLRPREIAVLRELAALREDHARHRDVPRGWIVSDSDLLRGAQGAVKNPGELLFKRGVWGKDNRYKEQIDCAITKALELDEQLCPVKRSFFAEDKQLAPVVDKLMGQIQSIAQLAGVDPQVIATRKEIKKYCREVPECCPDNHRILQGWRYEMLKDILS